VDLLVRSGPSSNHSLIESSAAATGARMYCRKSNVIPIEADLEKQFIAPHRIPAPGCTEFVTLYGITVRSRAGVSTKPKVYVHNSTVILHTVLTSAHRTLQIMRIIGEFSGLLKAFCYLHFSIPNPPKFLHRVRHFCALTNEYMCIYVTNFCAFMQRLFVHRCNELFVHRLTNICAFM
jgi:hypothetical protein